ncbi:MAG: hypothetical protein Q9169_008731 [Polycauliona sp. 2 TL-2023]
MKHRFSGGTLQKAAQSKALEAEASYQPPTEQYYGPAATWYTNSKPEESWPGMMPRDTLATLSERDPRKLTAMAAAQAAGSPPTLRRKKKMDLSHPLVGDPISEGYQTFEEGDSGFQSEPERPAARARKRMKARIPQGVVTHATPRKHQNGVVVPMEPGLCVMLVEGTTPKRPLVRTSCHPFLISGKVPEVDDAKTNTKRDPGTSSQARSSEQGRGAE